ncbi:PIF1-like helicase-domain-containing protein [Abortiporus biennis]|nr:PIF1-like helicase-domain-containing protein [Abortiporus biennis]
MAREKTLTTTTTNPRKRKSTGGIDDQKPKPAKQPRKTLDSFFAPQVLASGCPKDEKATTREHVALNEEQIKIMKMVVEEGKNIFFTGSAGTGKSLLLRAIIAALRKKYAKKIDCISVTASTGMAASNIGGMTIHSWGAITPGMTNVEKLISYIKTCRPAHQRWKATKVLIIDEGIFIDLAPYSCSQSIFGQYLWSMAISSTSLQPWQTNSERRPTDHLVAFS